MKLFSIETGNFKLDGGATFGVVPKILWQKVYPADENNLCPCAIRSLLVDTGDRKILIDNGIGDKMDEKFLMHYNLFGDDSLKKSFDKSGYSFDDITDVILTHLHFDHCGGSVILSQNSKLEPTFKNARYWCSQQQFDWAMNSNKREKASYFEDNFLPIKASNQLHLIDKDTELFNGFKLKIYFGHTEGLIIPFIKTKNRTIVFVGDLIPTAAHVQIPYIAGYDIRPLISLKEKEELLNEAADENHILFFQHDFFTECCTVYKAEKGIKVKETFKLSDLEF